MAINSSTEERPLEPVELGIMELVCVAKIVRADAEIEDLVTEHLAELVIGSLLSWRSTCVKPPGHVVTPMLPYSCPSWR
jgi:hypothetical protein